MEKIKLCLQLTTLLLFFGQVAMEEIHYIDVLEGTDVLLEFSSSSTFTTCFLKTPDEVMHEVYPGVNKTLPLPYSNRTLSNEMCSVAILNVKPIYTGTYALCLNPDDTKLGSELNTTYIRVQVAASTWPSKGMVVYEGQDFFMKLKKPVEFMEECHIVYKNSDGMKDITIKEDSAGFITYFGNGIQEGDCGFRAHGVNMANSGVWHVYTANNTNYSVIADVYVTVFNETSEILYTEYELGSNAFVNTNVEDLGAMKYCQKLEPYGDVDVAEGHCSWNVDTITESDAGNYTAKFALSGRMLEIESTNIVSVIEADSFGYREINVSVTASEKEKGAIDLLCQIVASSEESEAKFCRFVNPNGTGILVTDGIGSKRLSHYGSGLNSGKNKNCGLTIHKPIDEDYGTWTCYIYWQQKLRKGFLNLLKEDAEEFYELKTSSSGDMVVLNGTANVNLYCEANTMLDYCWFLHPNKTHIIPKYDTEDLHSGKCSYRISIITKEDEGTWICYMGVANHPDGDVREEISIKISDMKLMAISDNYMSEMGSSIKVSCKTIRFNKTLSYCRFVRPDGRGIGVFKSTSNDAVALNRYLLRDTSLSNGDCSLIITSVSLEDLGQWRCAAVIKGTTEEISDVFFLSLKTSGDKITAAGISGIAVGVAVVIVGIFAGLYFVMRRNRRVPISVTLSDLENNHRPSEASSSGSSNELFVPVAGHSGNGNASSGNEAEQSDLSDRHRKYS